MRYFTRTVIDIGCEDGPDIKVMASPDKFEEVVIKTSSCEMSIPAEMVEVLTKAMTDVAIECRKRRPLAYC